ncbi:MAG: nucleotidyl transferase AbiEii/AbiGii toxin family protein [bacterium]
MKVLTTLKEEFLKIFSTTKLKNKFYLTGETAFSAFYLQHRISEDMDFFTEEEREISRALPIINEIAFNN